MFAPRVDPNHHLVTELVLATPRPTSRVVKALAPGPCHRIPLSGANLPLGSKTDRPEVQ